MKSALQWTQETCSDLHGVILKSHEISDLVLAVQADTAQWASDTFNRHDFRHADDLVCNFASQAREAVKTHED